MFEPENLISDEYRAINAALHRDRHYGISGFQWTSKVDELRDHISKSRNDDEKDAPITVLDYGCGQGSLGDALGRPDWLREYDPAVDGKSELPKTVSDIVICTDVLEHIEPDKVDTVLKHINSCSRNLVFLSIATVPAEKVLPDGRNAHISLHDKKWWREKLESIPFLIAEIQESNGWIQVLCSSTRELMDMINTSAVSDTIRREQAFINCAKTPNRVNLINVKPHGGRAVIVCYGPSLKNHWHLIPRERNLYGAKIVTVSGAHDFLISKGIIPDIHMECDPREHKGFFTKTPHPEVEYQMASCCHPKVIDNLMPHNLSLWHVFNSMEDLKIIEEGGPDPTNVLTGGGGSIGCRAVNVMYSQGYRSFSIYGFDCSFDRDEQHAGPHSGKVQKVWAMKAGDRWFNTSGNMVYIARSFISNMSALYKTSILNGDPLLEDGYPMQLDLHGDGLLQHLYRHPEYDPTKVNWQNGNRVDSVEEELLEDGEAPQALPQENDLRGVAGTGAGRAGEGRQTVAA